MYTIGELADELNRQEWAVERMLRNRGYFKQNGDPRKWVIDEGLMDEDGMITEEGWSTFIDDLGYKNPKEDDDDDDEDENEEDDGDDDDDDEPDEDEVKNRIRSELGDVDEEIVDALYKKFEECYQEDEDVEAAFDYIQNYYDDITSSLSEGHTLTYVLTMISCCDVFGDYISVYQEMAEEEIIDDVKSVGECRGYSQATIDDVDQMYSDGYPDDPISLMEVFEEAYNRGLEHYSDEGKAREYALACRRGGAVADFDDDFEEYLSEGEPWINTDTSAFEDPFPSNPSNNPFSSDYYEYSAEDILAWYNEHSDEKPNYTSGDWEFSIGCWTFTSKAYYDDLLASEEDDGENEEEDYDED